MKGLLITAERLPNLRRRERSRELIDLEHFDSGTEPGDIGIKPLPDTRRFYFSPVSGEDTVAGEERRKLTFHVGVVPGREEPFERIEADHEVEFDAGQKQRERDSLVDDAGLVRGHDRQPRKRFSKRQEHAYTIGQRGAVESLIDVSGGQQSDGAAYPERFESAFQQVLVCVRRWVERRGQDRGSTAKRPPSIESLGSGPSGRVQAFKADSQLLGHCEMLTNSG